MNKKFFGIDREDGSICETTQDEQDEIKAERGYFEYLEITEFPDDVTDDQLREYFEVGKYFRVYRNA